MRKEDKQTPYSIQWKTSTWKRTRPRKQTKEEMRQLNENWKTNMQKVLKDINTLEDSIITSSPSSADIKWTTNSFKQLKYPGIINRDKTRTLEDVFQKAEKEKHQSSVKYKDWKENPFYNEGKTKKGIFSREEDVKDKL